jgi:hypothetical protein
MLYSITYAINIINIVDVLNKVSEGFMNCVNPAVRHYTPLQSPKPEKKIQWLHGDFPSTIYEYSESSYNLQDGTTRHLRT